MEKRAKATNIANAVPASFVIEEYTDAENLVRFASFQRWLDGEQPYMVEGRIERSLAALEVLPEGVTLERSVSSKSVVALNARGEGVTVGMEVGLHYTEYRVSARTHDEAAKLAQLIEERAAVLQDKNRVPVRVWRLANGARYDDRMLDAPQWNDIAVNYPGKVSKELSEVMALPRPEKSDPRLVLWSGEPGTGKTTAIRSLAREWAHWCAVQYISDPERLFNEPGYMNDVLDETARDPIGPTLHSASVEDKTWRLIVAEDTDEFLQSNARDKAGAALGRVLNLTDGILGQHHEVLVLLTTNEEISRLHPALVRPGRCLSNITFTRFSVTEGRRWLDGASRVTKAMTLAELLAKRGDIKDGSGQAQAASLPIGAYL